MPVVPFSGLMQQAELRNYAVGYFESWNLESLLAVRDAAEEMRSPVILGFSGIYLPHPNRASTDPLSAYAAIGLDICHGMTVPTCLLFNESPNMQWVRDAVDAGFGLVMFSDEAYTECEQTEAVRRTVSYANPKGVAVEGELVALAGVGGDLGGVPTNLHLTCPDAAVRFVEETGVDALAVNIGQVHLHGRQQVGLDLERLSELRKAVSVPLVLHGSTSVRSGDIASAVELGIRKINVGSVLKQVFLSAMTEGCIDRNTSDNPYEVIGSGLPNDVLMQGRLAMKEKVKELMLLFGSAGQAPII